MRKRFICMILCLIIVFGSALSVNAQEQKDIYYILNTDRFLEFAENCRLDSYSEGLTVMLCRDIDLSDTGFTGIPIFSGTFEGNGHTVTGLQLAMEGSNTGLFRYLTETAVVRDLHITGDVTPGGTGSTAGSLAGVNAGTVENCSFEGNVIGIDSIGGLVGTNQLTGSIANCTVSGIVNGHHFVGGIAGSNYGVIKNCENHAQVNITLEQNDVDLEDITLDTILNSESAVTVTDIGGICGTGTGVIRGCDNHGRIGYPQVGYNIGGIAGSFSGYIDRCTNHADIDGRKEIGGIVGQLEPAVSMIYEEDTLQTLQQQMDDLSDTAGGIGSSIQNGSNALNTESQQVEKQLQDAQDALKVLIPDDSEDYVPPDEEALQAARNALSSSLSNITGSIGTMAQISQNTFGSVSSSLQAIGGQLNAISGTIGTASENLGGGIQDVSDLDTDEDLTAKVSRCKNQGRVQGDWNIGGITGSIAIENDLDPESDLQIIGNLSFNYDMQLRAVIVECENQGIVYGKKQHVGGIAGWTSMGLVKQCLNTAAVDGATADYAGGIVGNSTGYIRQCSVKSIISGETYTGGIAGIGTIVTDCLSMVILDTAGEKSGAVLGDSKDPELSSNYYLVMDQDPGAVDGISYATQAEPLTDRKFFALDSLPDDFRNVAVFFRYDEDTTHRLILPFGTVMDAKILPAIPQDMGQDAVWAGDVQPDEPLLFDTTFTIVKPDYQQTLESDLKASNDLPVLLVQGQFNADAVFSVDVLDDPGALIAYELSLPVSQSPIKLRCLLPENTETERLLLLTQTDKGWQETEYSVNGSYLVFEAPENIHALRIKELHVDYTPYIIGGSAVAVAAVLAVVIALIVRRRKRKKA